MNLFKWIAGAFRARQETNKSSSSMSILSGVLQSNGRIETATCTVHRTTFPIPVGINLNVSSTGVVLDVGGYCPRCCKYRCPKCSQLVPNGTGFYTPGCKSCGTILRSDNSQKLTAQEADQEKRAALEGNQNVERVAKMVGPLSEAIKEAMRKQSR